MKKAIIFTLFALVFNPTVQAQQDPLYTQYIFNPLVINPAYAGTQEGLEVTVLSRFQWVGFEDAPRTQTISMHMPIQEKHGAGLEVVSDITGPTNSVTAMLDYAYQLKFDDDTRLSLGIRGGVMFNRLDWDKFFARDETDVNLLGTGKQSAISPNFDFGAHFMYKEYYAGLSLMHLTRSKMGYDAGNTQLDARSKIHVIMNAGGTIKLAEKVNFKPSVIARFTEGSPYGFDLNANIDFNNVIMMGGGYRTNNDVIIMAAATINDNLRIGYSFDLNTSKINTVSNNSHEVSLRFMLNTKKKEEAAEKETKDSKKKTGKAGKAKK